MLQLATPASSSSRGGLHCAVSALARLIGEQPELHSQGPSSSILAKVGDTFPCLPPTPPTGCLLGATWGRRKVPLYPMTQRAVVAPMPGQSGHCPCLVSCVPRASDRSWWAVTAMGAQGRGTGSPDDSNQFQPAPCGSHKIFISRIIEQNRSIQVGCFLEGNPVGRKIGMQDKGRS